MSRKLKVVSEDRSVGFNISMPLSWLKKIDADASKKGLDRSEWFREAAKLKLPNIV